MNDSKLPHAIFGTVISWWFTWLSYANENVSIIAGWASIAASIVTAVVGIRTLWKWSKGKGKEE